MIYEHKYWKVLNVMYSLKYGNFAHESEFGMNADVHHIFSKSALALELSTYCFCAEFTTILLICLLSIVAVVLLPNFFYLNS